MNLFVGSGTISWAITLAIIPLFSALTISETHQAKKLATEAAENGDLDAANRIALDSAVGLYLSIINLFLAILRIAGLILDHVP